MAAGSRVARYEVILAVLGLVVATAAMVYLAINALVNHESCYGVTSAHIECLPLDQAAGARVVVVLGYLAPLYLGAALAMRWQTRADEPTARNTAFGAMVTCMVLLLSLVVSAIGGSGFFLLPSALLMTAAAILGVIVWARGLRFNMASVTAPFARRGATHDAAAKASPAKPTAGAKTPTLAAPSPSKPQQPTPQQRKPQQPTRRSTRRARR